ncbi:hypothetical protein SpCBS45565_g05094 [Spizellomyces sp. 'palustris']|nr:hypothetical protein SpCBS45565_g05094 [Spizellomyces sp. 'palustris']
MATGELDWLNRPSINPNLHGSLHPLITTLPMASIVNINSANLLRLGALGVGVFYGFTHKASLTRFVQQRKEEAFRKHHEELIEEAKVAYEAQVNKEQAVLAKKAGIPTIDSDSYRFDAERYLNFAISQVEKDTPAPKK